VPEVPEGRKQILGCTGSGWVPAFLGLGEMHLPDLLGDWAVPERAQLLRNRKAPPVPAEARGLAGSRVEVQPWAGEYGAFGCELRRAGSGRAPTGAFGSVGKCERRVREGGNFVPEISRAWVPPGPRDGAPGANPVTPGLMLYVFYPARSGGFPPD
jgi:hypothetical protein